MADLRPFRALRYDTSLVRLEDVLTQPYDKISPEMQQEYYQRSPHNLIRFELAKREPGAAPESVYAQSAHFLSALLRDGVLKLDETPSLYAYGQRFRHPLEPGRSMERMGLIALGRLYDYDEHVVFRHELTLSGPKVDRMNLLRATRTHSGQIVMLYEDRERRVDQLLAGAITGRMPDASARDEYGVENLLWRIGDSTTIAKLVAEFADKKLIIADGHHRYETARAYRDELAAQGRGGPQAHDFVMMTLVNMNSPGLIVLPTHRVVFGLEPDWPIVTARLAEYFVTETVADYEEPAPRLREEQGRTSFIMATAAETRLLCGIAPAIARALPELSSEELKIDVTVLHELVLERAFGLSEEDIREQRHVHYFREPEKALAELKRGANAVFLVNPVPLSVLRDVCYAGKVMPQKSTDFYPKLLSGFTMYDLDHSFQGVQLAESR